jgi:hypothetical protein
MLKPKLVNIVTNLVILVMPVTDLLLVNVLLVTMDHQIVTMVNCVQKVLVNILVLFVMEIPLFYLVLLSVIIVLVVS